MLNRIVSLLLLLVICYFVVQAFRFLVVMLQTPKGALSKALMEAEFDWETDDLDNPIERDRRMARARGDFTK